MILRLLILLAAPALIAFICIFGPFTTDPALLFSGLATDTQPGWLPGFGTADPNMGITSDALGKRAALDVLSGTLPLWDHLAGLGAPLLGSLASAALFPPTLLLLLPHGQVLEQTSLQFVAGLGTYLFLRRFGLGTAAALAGGVLFELNGVFALLRNAVFNPVAFLPWLLFVVESLRQRVVSPWRARLPFVGLGALVASCAVYAGFPEVVYLYTLLIVGWVTVRFFAMPLVQGARFVGDLAAASLLALLISAPLLLAFSDFLAEAIVGFHTGILPQASRTPASLVLTLLPYVYGPIVSAPVQAAAEAWSGVGGYLGFMPPLLAIAGLWCARRQPICWLMAAWVLISVAVSHAAPVLYPLFLYVPFVKLTLFYRYLDAGSILCCVTLGAVFLDRVPTLSARQLWSARWIALGGTLAVLVLALALAAPALAALWGMHAGFRSFGIGSLTIAAALAVGFGFARSRPTLIALAVCEAAITFVFPLTSFKRAQRLDRPLIAFLREHVGLQRVAVAADAVLLPNYPSAFGFASINYDNLPVPIRTAAYAAAYLDPKAIAWTFWPTADLSRSHEELQSVARAHLSGYQNAAVRYLISGPDLFGTPAYELLPGAAVPIQLSSGDQLTLDIKPQNDDIQEALLSVGTFGGSANGILRARLCEHSNCVEASADLTTAPDNGFLSLRFARPLKITAGMAQITLRKEGGQNPVVLWARLAPSPASIAKPLLIFNSTNTPRRVFDSKTASVFELPNAKAYASAPGCRITPISRDQFESECEAPARLIRREVWMQGWAARVNGAPAPVQLDGDTFQAIDLPAGNSSVSFSYDPTGVRASFWPALGGLLVSLALLASARISPSYMRDNKNPFTT